MRIAPFALLALIATSALAHAQGSNQDRLVAKAREAAAWSGVEASRIRVSGNVVTVIGNDRQGRSVSITMDRASGDAIDSVVHRDHGKREQLASR